MSGTEPDTTGRAEKAQQAQLEAQDEIDVLAWLMTDKRGRRFVWRLLAEAGVYQSTFTGDPLTSAFAEGKRAQGLKLTASIFQHCPDRFSEMQKEARNYDRRNERTRSSGTSARS